MTSSRPQKLTGHYMSFIHEICKHYNIHIFDERKIASDLAAVVGVNRYYTKDEALDILKNSKNVTMYIRNTKQYYETMLKLLKDANPEPNVKIKNRMDKYQKEITLLEKLETAIKALERQVFR